MALKTHYRAAVIAFVCCSHTVHADATPVRSYIESISDINLGGVPDSEFRSVIDQQQNSATNLGPAVSTVTIDSKEGFYTATTDSFATFDDANRGSFHGTATYEGRQGDGDVDADFFEHTLWCIYEYDFIAPHPGQLQISGTLNNGGPSSISYFGFIQVFSENDDGTGFGNAFFLHEIFDLNMDSESIHLTIPLDADSKSYRVHMRIGHNGTTVLNAAPSLGSISVDWVIDAPNPCPADFDENGTLNFSDVSLFLEALINQDPVADINNDGNHNFADLSQYLVMYIQGCSKLA